MYSVVFSLMMADDIVLCGVRYVRPCTCLLLTACV